MAPISEPKLLGFGDRRRSLCLRVASQLAVCQLRVYKWGMPIVNPSSGDILLTLTEIAGRWGVGVDVVMKLHVGRGKLEGQRVGRATFVAAAAVKVYEQKIKRMLLNKRDQIDVKLARLSVELPTNING